VTLTSSTPTPAAIPTPPTTTATTAVPTSPPVAAASDAGAGAVSSGVLVTSLLSAAVIAAIVGALVNLWLARRKGADDERARVRATFAEAYEAVAQYKEFPYAIRRRRDNDGPGERVRLSDELREVQARLSYYALWVKAESDDVGAAYDGLVSNLRRIAGKACHDAWEAPPARSDADMNIGPDVVDLRALTSYEHAYVQAVHDHLQSWKRLRRLWRSSRA
jgi:hypothetical protein